MSEMLRIITGRRFGVAFAHVLDGSVIQRTFVGFTRRQAVRRANFWLAFTD